MNKQRKILAIIPARAGSKGIKNKNIVKLGNIPLILWTIKSALKSKKIDKLIVDTDSKEIINICKNNGVKHFIKRPKRLALDNTLISDVLINSLKNNFENFDSFVLLQPTSPFRTSRQIDMFINHYYKSNYKFLISISANHKPIEWHLKMSKNKKLDYVNKKNNLSSNRQNFKISYLANGLFYMANIKMFLNKKSFINSLTRGYIINDNSKIDIDNYDDLNYAKYLVEKNQINYE